MCIHQTLAKQNHKLAVDMPHKLKTQLDILEEQSQDAKVCVCVCKCACVFSFLAVYSPRHVRVRVRMYVSMTCRFRNAWTKSAACCTKTKTVSHTYAQPLAIFPTSWTPAVIHTHSQAMRDKQVRLLQRRLEKRDLEIFHLRRCATE